MPPQNAIFLPFFRLKLNIYQILALPTDEKAILAQRIWDSIEHFVDSAVEEAWLNVAEKRWKEIEQGVIQCEPAEEVMKKVRAGLKI